MLFYGGIKIMVKMVKAVLNGKYVITLPEHRAARPEWYTLEGWEKPRLDHMHSTTKNGDIVYYIGAEEGEMCALVSQWGAEVIMFEPNERVMPNIKAIWEANNLDMHDMFFAGFAGNQVAGNQELTFVKDIEGEVISDHGFKELRDPGERPITTIDSMVERTAMIPNMITMDTEGSEWEILQGAEKTLDEYHPRIYLSLHPEFLIDQYGKYSREVRDWLIGKGYEETLLDWQHEGHFVYEFTND